MHSALALWQLVHARLRSSHLNLRLLQRVQAVESRFLFCGLFEFPTKLVLFMVNGRKQFEVRNLLRGENGSFKLHDVTWPASAPRKTKTTQILIKDNYESLMLNENSVPSGLLCYQWTRINCSIQEEDQALTDSACLSI